MIQDWVLFVMVGVLVAIDVVYLVIITSIPTSRLRLEDIEIPSNVCTLNTYIHTPHMITLHGLGCCESAKNGKLARVLIIMRTMVCMYKD